MKIKLGATIINIPKNKLNKISFWNPIGMFPNLPMVQKDDKWYKCSLTFIEKNEGSWVQIHDLMIVAEDHTIKYHERGIIYKEFKVSKFKINLCKMLMNQHPWNRIWFNFRKRIHQRRNTIGVFFASISLALIYFYGNQYNNNAWGRYIAANGIIQALFILLNIFTLGSVFFPFTIRKELTENDIKELLRKEIEEYEKEKIQIKRAQESATI